MLWTALHLKQQNNRQNGVGPKELICYGALELKEGVKFMYLFIFL
jgi:hypothetical protein